MTTEPKLQFSTDAASATISLEDGFEFVVKADEAQLIVEAQNTNPDRIIQATLKDGGSLYFKPSRVIAVKLG
jgi:hypothetical protein